MASKNAPATIIQLPKTIIDFGKAFCENSDMRPVLNTVNLRISGNRAVAQAADGFLAATMEFDVSDVPENYSLNAMLERRALDLISKLPERHWNKFALESTSNTITRIGYPHVGWITVRPVDGTFPKLDEVMASKKDLAPISRIVMNPELLGRIVTFAKKIGTDSVHFGFNTPQSGIRVGLSDKTNTTNAVFDITLMPMVSNTDFTWPTKHQEEEKE